MSVEQPKTIDIISTNTDREAVILTISDHLDWLHSVEHQRMLQDKLNSYLAFVESGEIYEEYPNAKYRSIEVRIIFKYPPDSAGWEFINRVKPIIESAGMSVICDVQSESD